MTTEYDQRQRRCPKLGGIINFGYCRTCDEERQPCHKVLDCWWEYFDVVGYFRDHLSAEGLKRLSASKPPDKMVSLVDMIAQARRRCRNSES